MSAYTSLNSLFLLTFFIASLRASAQLQDPTYVGHNCTNTIPRNTAYFSNLQTLLTSLSSNAAFFVMGSHSLAKGQNTDMVFGLYLCKGDLSPEACRDCVAFATKDALTRCRGRKEVLIQYDECMLGYADRNIFIDAVTTTRIITWNTQNITADLSERFNDTVFSLINKSAVEAANSTTKKFAVSKSDFTSSRTLYASVQCNPDLSSEDCVSCLQRSIKEFYFSSLGGRVLVPSCNSRYELYPFYNETLLTNLSPSPPVLVSPPVTAPPLPHGKGGDPTVIILAICVLVSVFVLFVVAVLSYRVVKKTDDTTAADDDEDDITIAGSLQFDFKVLLWSGPDLNQKKAKISWKDVCKPKEEGGLGLKQLRDVNTVTCLKLLWRIVSANSSLWVLWLRTYLIRKGSFWSINSRTQTGSWMWRKILKLRTLARDLHQVDIRNGHHTSFWFDRWSPHGCLHDLTGDSGFIALGIPAAASVEDVLLSHRRRRHRNVVLNEIEETIGKYRVLRVAEGTDVALWRQKENDFKAKFNSKKTWHQIRQLHDPQQWTKCIWFSYATPKYAFLAWLAIQNRLSTRDRTQSWNEAQDPKCLLCNQHLESRSHLFFSCAFSAEVWKRLVAGIMNLEYSETWSDIISYILQPRHTFIKAFVIKYVFQAALYGIWRERNLRKHGEKPSPPSRLATLIDKTVRNRLSTARATEKRLDDGLIFWFGSRT